MFYTPKNHKAAPSLTVNLLVKMLITAFLKYFEKEFAHIFHEKDGKTGKFNFRPISIFWNFSKIYEGILY